MKAGSINDSEALDLAEANCFIDNEVTFSRSIERCTADKLMQFARIDPAVCRY